MINKPLRNALLVAAASLGLGACTDGYGYGGVGLGWGSGYYDDYYGYPYRYGPRLGYGWYDGFYYPGTGYYVIDRSGHRHRWSDRQRRYWQSYRHRGGHYSGGRAWMGQSNRWSGQTQSGGSWSGTQSGTSTFQGGATTGGGTPGTRWRGRQ